MEPCGAGERRKKGKDRLGKGQEILKLCFSEESPEDLVKWQISLPWPGIETGILHSNRHTGEAHTAGGDPRLVQQG